MTLENPDSGYDGPRRAYRLVLDLEADDYDELLKALDQIGLDLSLHPKREGGEITSGGYSSGWHMEIAHQSRQNGGRYRRELMQWCDRRREERRARAATEETK